MYSTLMGYVFGTTARMPSGFTRPVVLMMGSLVIGLVLLAVPRMLTSSKRQLPELLLYTSGWLVVLSSAAACIGARGSRRADVAACGDGICRRSLIIRIVHRDHPDAEVRIVLHAGDAERMEVDSDLVVERAAAARDLDGPDRRPRRTAVGGVEHLEIAHALVGRVPVELQDDVVIAGGIHHELRALRAGRSSEVPAVTSASFARLYLDPAPRTRHALLSLGAMLFWPAVQHMSGSELRVVPVTSSPLVLPTVTGDVE